MSTRHRRRGREEAFRLLFQAEQAPRPWDEVLAAEAELTELPKPAWEFARELAESAWAEHAELDPLLDQLAKGWSLERLAAADRAILRLGSYELIHRADTPVAVIINEAVELAKRYGTDDSPRFINGILGTLAREHRDEPLELRDDT